VQSLVALYREPTHAPFWPHVGQVHRLMLLAIADDVIE
jgi:hypothetical protein